jgi:hypothetical protein
MMSCSLSMLISSGSYRVSGAILAGSLPLRVCFGASGCGLCYILLGPGIVFMLAVYTGPGFVYGAFLMVAMSTWRSMTACTNFVGLIVSGSSSAILVNL